jgi:hypothetical protein
MQRIDRWPFLLLLAVLFAALTIPASPAQAQEAALEARSTAPRVFFDCNSRDCDRTYYRTEIPWVNWVRDQQDADVHVIMTSQSTGAGGQEYLLDFMGRAAYQNYEAQSRYQSLPTDTQRERLDGVALTLGLGLATFATQFGFRDVIRLDGLASAGGVDANAGTAEAGLVSADQVQDPWNLWVLSVDVNGNFDGESTTKEYRLNSSVSASRVTPTWKQRYRANFDYRNLEQERTDNTLISDIRRDFGINADVTYALAEHWSVGFNSMARRNTRQNQRFMTQFNSAIEYSFFPYEEATRRSLTAYYEIGSVYRDYFEVTRDGKLEETRGEQALTLSLSQRQTWGNASIRLRGSNYLHDFDRHNVSLFGSLSFRITRGLDVNFGTSYSRVNDQLYLSGEGLTDEERFLRLRQEATDYEASIRFGVSYTFGSIFNNVVNNRFGRGGGRRFF